MPARGLDGIEDAEPPGSSHADDIALDPWLRNQVLKRCVNVVRRLAITCAAAFPKSPDIERERVDSGSRQLRGHFIPGLSRPVGLVQQQHPGARFGWAKVPRLQAGPGGCFRVTIR